MALDTQKKTARTVVDFILLFKKKKKNATTFYLFSFSVDDSSPPGHGPVKGLYFIFIFFFFLPRSPEGERELY